MAEKYLLWAEENGKSLADINGNLILAIIFTWSAIESFINNMFDDFGALPETNFQLHERAFLLEKRIKFCDSGNNLGKFSLEGTEYRRLEDKITFLISKFGHPKNKVNKGDTLWQDFMNLKEARDRLIHPHKGKEVSLNIGDTNKYLETAKKIIQLVSQNVWKKKVEF